MSIPNPVKPGTSSTFDTVVTNRLMNTSDRNNEQHADAFNVFKDNDFTLEVVFDNYGCVSDLRMNTSNNVHL